MTTTPPDTADATPSDKGATPLPVASAKDALSSLDRTLQVDDLKHRGTQKLVLDRLDKAERDLSELKSIREDRHDKDKRLAVAEEELRGTREAHSLRTVLNTVAGFFFGLVPSADSISWLAAVLACVALAMLGFSLRISNWRRK